MSTQSSPVPQVELRMNAPLQECDVAIVSIDDRGLPGRLNRSVLEALGYSEADRPGPEQLRAGHALLQADDRKPVLFVVIVGIGKTEDLLAGQLASALEAYGERFFGARYWIPLLGTGRGGLSDARSLELILQALARYHRHPAAARSSFLISLPETAEAQALIETVEANGGTIRAGGAPMPGPASGDGGHTGYYLMKMTPSSWYFPSIREGDATYFATHYFAEPRPEYELLRRVQPGDQVIGYAAGDMQQVWGLMAVTEGAHADASQGEIISMVVRQIFSAPPLFSRIRDLLSGETAAGIQRVSVPPLLFFELGEAAFTEMLRRSNAAPEVYVNPFKPFYLTEGRHRETDDQLEFRNDIESFATIISQGSVKPPLAIGLFGNWGSGKSFFMEKLEAKIRELAGSGTEGTVSNVVHVRFNSWHYSDTNLWASLITEIFEQLNAFVLDKHRTTDVEAIYRELELTKLQLSATRQEIETNTRQRETLGLERQQLQQQRQDVQSRLRDFRAGNLLEVVLNDARIQARIRKFNDDFDIEPISGSLDDISARIDVLGGAWGRLREAWRIVRSYRGWKPVALLAVILLIVPLCGLLVYRYRDQLNAVLLNLGIAGAALAAALTRLVKWLRPGIRTVNSMYRSLRDMQQAIDLEHRRLERGEGAIIRSLEAEQQRLEAEEQRLQERLDATAAREQRLQDELANIGSGRMLAGFLASKSADEAYIRQLGIISWIRKDFARLNRLFENQQTVRAKQGDGVVEIGIDRIILYIDDLDRCNETVVVQVLEAIHLLLAFELFVVVVGVDPRWLNNALTLKYKKLFGKQSAQGAADPYDYLEKIFQIPFALKPINDEGRQRLIAALLRAELEAHTSGMSEEQLSGGAAAAGALPDSAKHESAAGAESRKPDPGRELPAGAGGTRTGTGGDGQKPPGPAGKRLGVSGDELRFMQQLSPLFGHTPRTINRYVNIYRLLKAHGSLKVKSGFSADEYQPLMLLLGVVVGCRAGAEAFIGALAQAGERQPFAEFLAGGALEPGLAGQLRALTAGMDHLLVGDFQRNLDLVARFSFRALGRASVGLVQGDNASVVHVEALFQDESDSAGPDRQLL